MKAGIDQKDETLMKLVDEMEAEIDRINHIPEPQWGVSSKREYEQKLWQWEEVKQRA